MSEYSDPTASPPPVGDDQSAADVGWHRGVEPDNLHVDNLSELATAAGAALTSASVLAKAAIEKRADVRQAKIEAVTARLESEAETERTRIRETAETERERLRQQNPQPPAE